MLLDLKSLRNLMKSALFARQMITFSLLSHQKSPVTFINFKRKVYQNETLLHAHWNGQNLKRWQPQMLAKMWSDNRNPPIRCWWKCKMSQPPSKTAWQFLTKLNMLLLYDPAIMLLGIYPQKILHKDIYSSIVHPCWSLEAAKMSSSRWTNE